MTETKPTCPGCSGESRLSKDGKHFVCLGCGGRHGEVSYAYYRTLVKGFAKSEPSQDQWEYFDFTITGKRERYHGWRDRVTGELIQSG